MTTQNEAPGTMNGAPGADDTALPDDPSRAWPDRRCWPPELTELRPKRIADGRRVITGRDLAAMLGCTPENLRKMAAAGRLRREADLDQSTRSWYRVEEVARVYLERFPAHAPPPDEPPLPFVEARMGMTAHAPPPLPTGPRPGPKP